MSINHVIKKRGRGRPPVDSHAQTLRFPTPVVDALDAAAATDPTKPSRNDMIRSIVTAWLKRRGYMS